MHASSQYLLNMMSRENGQRLVGVLTDFSRYIHKSLNKITTFEPTVCKSQVPIELWEPAIEKGYRQTNLPWSYYVTSLFQIHNETVNVWTHLIGFLAIWWIVRECSQDMDFWQDKHSWPILVFGISCFIVFLGSALAHLLHSRSIYNHYIMIMIDLMGVSIYAFGFCVELFYISSDLKTYLYFRSIYLPLLTFVTILVYVVLCLAKLWYGDNPLDMRRQCMQLAILVLPVILGTLPIAQRYTHCFIADNCSMSSLNHITIIGMVFLFCAFFFGSHMPERLFPGKCDILGQGHQIFHVLLVINQVLQMHAISVDRRNEVSLHTDPEFLPLACAFVAVIIVEVAFLLVFMRLLPRDQSPKCETYDKTDKCHSD